MRLEQGGTALKAVVVARSSTTSTEDVREGVAAFFGRRDPEWRGR